MGTRVAWHSPSYPLPGFTGDSLSCRTRWSYIRITRPSMRWATRAPGHRRHTCTPVRGRVLTARSSKPQWSPACSLPFRRRAVTRTRQTARHPGRRFLRVRSTARSPNRVALRFRPGLRGGIRVHLSRSATVAP